MSSKTFSAVIRAQSGYGAVPELKQAGDILGRGKPPPAMWRPAAAGPSMNARIRGSIRALRENRRDWTEHEANVEELLRG